MPVLTPVLLLLLLLFGPLPALAYDVLILQSLREKGYTEAVSGVKQECAASTRTVVLSDFVAADVTRIVREERPKLVVAVGERALELASRVREIPVLYLMVLKPRLRPLVNQTGVTLLVDPARYLGILEGIGARRVGVLYDPEKSGPYLKKAHSAARRAGIELVTREVRHPKDTPALLDSLHGKVDALWMLPDLTAVSSETTEAYFLFSQGERVPVITFSELYLSMGGAIALGIDRFDIGRQVGEMARQILDGGRVEEIALQSPRKVTLKANAGVLRRLKIDGSGLEGL